MKNTIVHFLMSMSTLFCIVFSNTALAEGSQEHSLKTTNTISDERCYLMPGTLSMDRKKLYVNLNGTVFPINNVSVDEQGVYILASEFVDLGIIAYCPVGHANPPWNLVCQICGRNIY